jgi:hypothetical protein
MWAHPASVEHDRRVAQISKSAVPQASSLQDIEGIVCSATCLALPIWKSAVRQIWKSALQGEASP